MAKITLDGKDYDSDTFSENAKSQLASLQFTQNEINRLQGLLAIAQTAQAAYSTALKRDLEGE